MARRTVGLRGLVVILLLVMFIATCVSARDPVNSLANKKEGSKRKPSNVNPPPKPRPKSKLKSKPKPNPEPTPSPIPASPAIKGGSTFNVLDYGAKGDGVTDDAKVTADYIKVIIVIGYS